MSDIQQALDELKEACQDQKVTECIFVGFAPLDGLDFNSAARDSRMGCLTYCSAENDNLMLNTILSLVEILARKRGMAPAEMYAKLYADYGEVQHISKVRGFTSVEDMKADDETFTLPEPKTVGNNLVEIINKLLGGKPNVG